MFADEAAAIADAGEGRQDDPAAIAYLKEQQWTNEFATALVQEAELRPRSACRPRSSRCPAARPSWPAPAAGRFMADALPVDRRSRARPARCSAHLEPRLAAGRRSRHARGRRRRSPSVARGARASSWRAPSGCWPSAPCRRAASRTRAARSRSPRRGCSAAEARLAQRDETLRTGGGAAAGNAFVLRAPIAGRVAEVLADARRRRTTKARRSSGSSGPIASSCRCRCPRRRAVGAAGHGARARDSRPAGAARRSSRITCTTPA